MAMGADVCLEKDLPRSRSIVKVNRGPILTLWAAIVAQRLGFTRDEALSWAERWPG
jgi:hypothetical protein